MKKEQTWFRRRCACFVYMQMNPQRRLFSYFFCQRVLYQFCELILWNEEEDFELNSTLRFRFEKLAVNGSCTRHKSIISKSCRVFFFFEIGPRNRFFSLGGCCQNALNMYTVRGLEFFIHIKFHQNPYESSDPEAKADYVFEYIYMYTH